MKKTLIVALAGFMMFAFTQCGSGNGNGDNAGTTSSAKDTKQFTEVKKAYDEIEKMIKDADDCDKLQEASFTLLLGSLAVGLGGDQYTADEKMTEKENEQIEKIAENLMEVAKQKAEKMGCDFDLDD